ncbi:MAG: hypothetical protein ACI9MR_003796 [Myxococcota bacterium]
MYAPSVVSSLWPGGAPLNTRLHLPRCIAAALTLASLLSACVVLDSGVYVIGEAEGVALIEETLGAAGYLANARDESIDDVAVCLPEASTCEAPLSFTLDGWDAGQLLGFEYVSDGDVDFPAEPDLTKRSAALALQDATNQTLPTGAAVIVIGGLGHETALLAREQLIGRVEAALTALDR